ncbi:MAG TPA: DinB family protein [Terriglobales bacterium]|nr:DinB family protein [Terriglobales bacterium]
MDKLREELAFQLRKGNAHVPLEEAVKDLPLKAQGTVPKGMPYSAWQLLEHIRLAQRDMLDFCSNEDGHYQHKTFPDDYWPASPEPPNSRVWSQSVKQIQSDRDAFIALISDPKRDLFARFPWGTGQTLFHEACLILDHNAYHLGELVAVRRLLGEWKS